MRTRCERGVMIMKKTALASVVFLCTMALAGCNEESKQWEKDEVEEILENYYEPYYFGEGNIVDTEDEDAYNPEIETYSVFEDEDEENLLFNVKVYMKTGKVEEVEWKGGLLNSYNLNDIEEIEDTEQDEEENWISVEGSNFHNGIAYAKIMNTYSISDTRVNVIDVNGKKLFEYPQDSSSAQSGFASADYNLSSYKDIWNVDKEGEYIWIDDSVFDRNGDIIYSLPDKYLGLEIGNGYMMVLEKPSGYQQKAVKMGVIDGYGNEIIPVSEEFGKVCGEELPNPKDCEDGIVDFEYKEVVVDANQGIYYEDVEGFTDYQNNMMLYKWILYKDKGTSTVDYGDYYKYGRNITLSDDAVIVSGMEDGDFVIRTFDLNGTLINENRIADIILNQEELHYENGLSALYIDGMDGDYVTMIDELGNVQFDPIRCYNRDFSDQTPVIYGAISEGTIRVAIDETTTVFIDSSGKEVVRIPVNINCVGECENGRIAVNTETDESFYVDVETGEYIFAEVD